jgi:hypothetical protein
MDSNHRDKQPDIVQEENGKDYIAICDKNQKIMAVTTRTNPTAFLRDI